jgi:hypothetical protein
MRAILTALVVTVVVSLTALAVPNPKFPWPDEGTSAPGAGGNLGPYMRWSVADATLNANLCMPVFFEPTQNQGSCGVSASVLTYVAEDATITRIVGAVGGTDWGAPDCNVTIRDDGVALAGVSALAFGTADLDENGEWDERANLSIDIAAGSLIEAFMASGGAACSSVALDGSAIVEVYLK